MSAEVTWHPSALDVQMRRHCLGQSGATVWLTGLPASGKSTIAVALERELVVEHRRVAYLLDHCEGEGIGFIPWFPLATGELSRPGGPLDRLSEEIGATPSQLALAWLLRRAPVMLPIPGTSTVAHLEENLAAADVQLTDEQFEALSEIAG